MEIIFLEISLILITAAFTGTIAKLLKQPIIPAYILAGVLLGPFVFNVITAGELLETLATFGIAFLLFLVGIELDVRKFVKIGKTAIIAGILQMTFAVLVGYGLIRFLGFANIEALLLAFAMGFSSTIIGLKLMGEKKELDTLYGQIVIGMMLTQDMIAVLVLLFFDVFTGQFANGDIGLFTTIGLIILKALALFILAFASSKYILKKLFYHLANSAELLFLGSVCWCLVFSLLAMYLGFSIEVGALLAGVSLSFIPYSYEISYRIKSLRDFFLPIFFAVLGGQLIFSGGIGFLMPAVALSILVLIGSPIVVMFFLMRKGYRARTGFQSGIAISQISEFSFILIALAFTKGVIGHELVSLVAFIGLLTMTISSYMFEHNEKLYRPMKNLLRKFEKNTKEDELDELPDKLSDHIILVGYNAMGHRMYQSLKRSRRSVVVIDNNPTTLEKLHTKKIPSMYGSMNDDEVLERLSVAEAFAIISTVRSVPDTLELLEYARHLQLQTKLIVTAFTIADALKYYSLGATYVIVPPLAGAENMPLILRASDKKTQEHILVLEKLQKTHGRL